MNLKIKPMDAAWFVSDRVNPHVHFGPLLILSLPHNHSKDYVENFVKQWRRSNTFAAPFNYKLSKDINPKWEILDDDEIDLEYHFRHSALPKPGGEQELGALVSRLQSIPLDRTRPLWECHIIEGLKGGNFAIYLKLHHGQIDGMGSVKLMNRVFSSDPSRRDQLPPWSVGMKDRPAIFENSKSSSGIFSRWSEKTSEISQLVTKLPTLARVGLKTASYLSDAFITHDSPELSAPFKAPKTILNGRISDQRRYATQHYKLERLKNIAHKADVKINSVFLSICGGALRRYLAELDSLPKQTLVGQVPVNIRSEDDEGIGNAFSFIFAKLGTDTEDPLLRLQKVHTSTQSGKDVLNSMPAGSIETYTTLMAASISPLILGLGAHTHPAANLVISNVSGPRQRLYFNGAQVEHIYGPSVLLHGQALNITMSSYADEIDIGFTGCRVSLPSLQKLAVYTGEELAMLEKALEIKLPKESRAKKKSTKKKTPQKKTRRKKIAS